MGVSVINVRLDDEDKKAVEISKEESYWNVE